MPVVLLAPRATFAAEEASLDLRPMGIEAELMYFPDTRAHTAETWIVVH